MKHIRSLEEAEKILNSDGVIFKHSNACPISARAYEEVKNFSKEHEVSYLVVQTDRDVSDFIEEKTGVRHESPQILVIKDGEVKWHASHGKVSSDNIKQYVTT